MWLKIFAVASFTIKRNNGKKLVLKDNSIDPDQTHQDLEPEKHPV